MLFFLLSLRIVAEPCVVITTTEGETVFFFKEEPTFKYIGQTVKLSTSETQLDYAPTDILSVRIDDRASTGIQGLQAGKNMAYSISDNKVTVSGLLADTQARLYSSNGCLIVVAHASNEGRAVIMTGNLKTGVYIIKSNNSSIKIIKK